MKVLILEDDRLISEGLMISMIQEGYEAVATYTVEDAMNIINSGEDIGFCLLDVMLPDGDGYTVCREIRKRNNVPVLFITACDDEIHTVLALEHLVGEVDHLIIHAYPQCLADACEIIKEMR